MGVDRALFFFFVGLTLPIPYTAHFMPFMDILAFGIFVVLHAVGVLITRQDSQMLSIYRRHIGYKRYYSPVASVHASQVLRRPSVPVYQGRKGVV